MHGFTCLFVRLERITFSPERQGHLRALDPVRSIDREMRIDAKFLRTRHVASATGRMEKRFWATVPLRIVSLDRPWLVESTITENVSLFGARILVKDIWRLNEQVVVESPGGLYPCQARVIYCQLLKTGTAAVGLRLARARRDWMDDRHIG
jgi:hypothetical protein